MLGRQTEPCIQWWGDEFENADGSGGLSEGPFYFDVFESDHALGEGVLVLVEGFFDAKEAAGPDLLTGFRQLCQGGLFTLGKEHRPKVGLNSRGVFYVYAERGYFSAGCDGGDAPGVGMADAAGDSIWPDGAAVLIGEQRFVGLASSRQGAMSEDASGGKLPASAGVGLGD